MSEDTGAGDVAVRSKKTSKTIPAHCDFRDVRAVSMAIHAGADVQRRRLFLHCGNTSVHPHKPV